MVKRAHRLLTLMPLCRLIALQSQEVERGKAALGQQRAALEAAQAQAGALGGVVWCGLVWARTPSVD